MCNWKYKNQRSTGSTERTEVIWVWWTERLSQTEVGNRVIFTVSSLPGRFWRISASSEGAWCNFFPPYLSLWTGLVRASSLFPILSTVLLMMGGLCVGFGRIYSKRNNILLSAGILFVAAGRTRTSGQKRDLVQMWNLSGGFRGKSAALLLLLRPEQHHRYHRLHLQQRRRSQRQERRRPEEPVQLRLVLLFRRALLHRGRIHRCSRCQHLHREKQREAISRTPQLHQEHLLFITVFSHPKFPVPEEALALQFTVNGSIWRVVPGEDEDEGGGFGDGPSHGGNIPVRPQQGASEGRGDETLQPREGFWLSTGPQLLPERSKRRREQEDHTSLRAEAPERMISE